RTLKAYHQHQRDTWEIPPEIFATYDAEFHFTLDVCATAATAKCARFFSPAEDGLAQDWGTDVCWMNPPYGRKISAWLEKAYRRSLAGATVVCLIPARTDTRWWHTWVEPSAEIRFLKGRLRFSGATVNAPFPSAVGIYRPTPQEESNPTAGTWVRCPKYPA